MVETADKLKVKKDYNKIGTEDDPIIIAQRFLNIFRQLHIFTDERKQAFNQMILEQPAEVRGMFSSLPGGGVLQQYVDDLEAQHGIVRSIPDAAPQVDYEEEAKAKILATALAEANSQQHGGNDNSVMLAAQMAAESAAKAAAEAQAKIASQAAQEAKAAAAKAQEQLQAQAKALSQFQELLKNKNISNDDGDIEKVAPTAIFQPISSTVTADGDFAKEIASALKEAISVTDDNRKKDSENLTKAIIDSQNKLAEIMAQNNSANIEAQNRLAQMLVQNNTANNASSSNANNIQINTAATFPPVEEMISGIVKVQSELFKEMAKTQTSELSAIISLALKESQQLSTQSIITAIKEMQKENLKFLQMHPAIYNIRPSNANNEPFQAGFSQVKPSSNTQNQTDDLTDSGDIEDEIDLTAETSNDFSLENNSTDEISKKKKKKKKKKKNQEGLSLDGIASSLLDKVSSLTDKVTSLTTKKSDDEADILSIESTDNNTILPKEDDDIELLKLENDNNGLDISLFDNETPQDSIQDKNEQNISEPEIASDENVEWEYEEVPAPEILQTLDLSKQISEEDNSQNISSENALSGQDNDDNFNWHPVTVDNEQLSSETEVMPIDVSSEYDSHSLENFDIQTNSNLNEDIQEFDNKTEEKTNLSEQSVSIDTAESDEQNKEWEYEEVPENESPEPAQLVAADTENAEAQDWALEYKEVPEDESPEPEQVVAADTENAEAQDWALEYKEVPEDESQEPTQVVAAETESTDTQDWEWEYEEVPEDEGPEPTQVVAAETESADTQDWEWEYEEVPEDEGQEPEQVVAADTENADTQDWEWEYEEVPEDESQEPEQVVAADTENADTQDWEWEYEEVPEDESQEPEQVVAADTENADTQDWEWEYEEVPEDESQEPTQVVAAETESTDTQDWEWEYEEVPEDEGQPSLSEQLKETDNDKALKFSENFDDPYHQENSSNPEETSPLSSIYNGEVYFQDKVYQQQTDSSASPIDVPENISENFPLSDLDEKDEPYKPKSTI